ncbi:MAG: hypothetical protein N2255_04615 [Kiritimatiellae bacterium]|nr:hypothetical protein [Kiritimatiellia bacterium]
MREYNKARNCFETALALAPTNSATHSIAAVHLAGLLLHCFDDPGAAQSVLGRAVAEVLPPVERRLRQIYEGDIFLASGRIEAARRTYLEAGTTADRNDRNYVARRRARLETARTCLLRQEYDEAERLVREIEWETPIERLDTETGLIMIQVHLARQEYEFAYAHCQRLLKAATVNRHTPDLLFCLVETCSALKKNQEAALALGRLFAEFPYSEATARAREKWSFLSETGKRR